ncbi:hypothetical protein MYX07_06675 [Patescibacteria group bacterium AH-259-L07]|nr:hypothetical protein [Patescibacteria group bacterium AH-259-L07]
MEQYEDRVPLQGAGYKEQELYQWVLPIFKKYWERLKTNNCNEYILVVSEEASTPSCIKWIKYESDKETPWHIVQLSAREVERAKRGLGHDLDLYSGKKVTVSAMTWLCYGIVHEITHCFDDTEETDMGEAIAVKVGCEYIMQDFPDGELLAAALTSWDLVEAHLLGCLNIGSVYKIKLPLKFSEQSLHLIQTALEVYFLLPEFIKDIYEREKKPHPYYPDNYQDNYAKGFAKLIKKLNPHL